MTIEYIVIEETEDTATVEFVDSETKLSQIRTINIVGLDEADRYERYESHKRAFAYRIDNKLIKEQPEVVLEEPEEDPETKPKKKTKEV